MAKFQSVWAIDIGQAALKALKLTVGETPDHLIAEAFDYVEYPKILSQPDADAEELVREALETFLGRNDVKGSGVAIGVSGQAGLVKFIKLPPVDKSRVPDIVKFEARQHIPFALEEVVWDYQVIGGEEEDGDEVQMTEVGLFAMKRDQINRAILPLKSAGIEVDLVQMGPIALYNYVAYDEPPIQPEDGEVHATVLLDIGADNTDLIITDGVRIWQRNVPIGGNHFTRAISKEQKLTFAKAEHLKRNATKSADPRAVFTAMKGVFNDFSSEISRSIGFYSSVNRDATITRVVGLGNGFKLPGLQKYLQQNIGHDVQRLESFGHLVGDEVTAAPQFLENLASFAVPYGLAVQALGVGPLRTNLLPPEIQQVRMIRRKKPWALAAAALMLLGFSAMFLSAWNAYAKIKPLEAPAKSADSATSQGKGYASDYETAKSAFNSLKSKGESLVGDTTEASKWPELIQTVMNLLPNPAREFQAANPDFDPNDPKNAGLLGMTRVYVDRIVPVWRSDLGEGWFANELDRENKSSMHPYDRANPPSGPGWVIQVFGHHYNPSLLTEGLDLTETEKKVAEGPAEYLQYRVLQRFYRPSLRLYGIHHANLFWIYISQDWTTADGLSGIAPPPPLAQEQPPTEDGGASEGGLAGGKGGGRGVSEGMSSAYSNQGQNQQSRGGGMAGMTMSGGYPGASNMGGAMGANKEDLKTLTRTDFIIQFVWQPPTKEEMPATDEEAEQKVQEILTAMQESEKDLQGVAKVDVEALSKKSFQRSEQALEQARQEFEEDAAAAKAANGDGDAAPPVDPSATTAPPGQ